jgi:cold shock CspA family protein
MAKTVQAKETNHKAMIGTIRRAFLPLGYAFIIGPDGVEYFLHARELPEGQWNGDVIHEGARFAFVAEKSEKGWRATEVRPC